MAVMVGATLLWLSMYEKGGAGASIGNLTQVQGLVKLRNQRFSSWQNAGVNAVLFDRATLYVDQSSKATLQIGASLVHVDENTMIHLLRPQNLDELSLDFGSFSLTGKEKQQIRIRVGKDVLRLDMEQASLKLSREKNGKTKLVAVSGRVKLKSDQGKETTWLAAGQTIELANAPSKKSSRRGLAAAEPAPKKDDFENAELQGEAPVPSEPSHPVLESQVAPTPKPKPRPELVLTSENIRHVWTMREIYEISKTSLSLKESPKSVPEKIRLTWFDALGPVLTNLEIASTANFEHVRKLRSTQSFAELPNPELGDYYWRASVEDGHWSKTGLFSVTAGFASEGVPTLEAASSKLALLKDKVTARIRVDSDRAQLGFVGEVSESSDFDKQHSLFFWTRKTEYPLDFYRAGDYYVRFQAVSPERQQLSEWSIPIKLNIFRPLAPEVPRLAKLSDAGHVDAPLGFVVEAAGQSTLLTVVDENGKTVFRSTEKNPFWIPKKAGHFKARVLAINIYGQKSPLSAPSLLQVLPELAKVPLAEEPQPDKLAATKVSPQPESAKRAPASLEATTRETMPEALSSEVLNDKYKASFFSMDGFLWQLYSSLQVVRNQPAPISAGVGVNFLNWWNQWGAEGEVKTGLANPLSSDASSAGSNFEDLEVRAHYRINTGFPFGWARELQSSVFAGVEIYKNSANYFSDGYNLAKVGLSFHFPVWRHWSSGGEFVYGTNADGSTKQEISGFLHYYLQKNFSFGVGYRLHFYQAGSAASAPEGLLPYREGYTEAYSALGYHF